jgi:hypothetical protein
LSFDLTSLVVPFDSFVTVTTASATAAPWGSTSWPRIEPRNSCAARGRAREKLARVSDSDRSVTCTPEMV